MPWSAYLLIAGLSLSAGLNWYGAWAQKLRLYYATKPIVLLLLIALFILWGGTLPSALPFLLGLGFSLLGDICLIPRSQTWFLAGLIAFFAAHLFYIYAFNVIPAPPLPTALVGAAAGLLLLALSAYILRKTAKKPELKPMRRVFLPYAAALVLMAASGVLCVFRPGWPLPAASMCALGGLLFLISDTMHAADRMGKHIPRVKFWIIVTYHVAQFLIALSAARWARLNPGL